jgi:hypothetical protein
MTAPPSSKAIWLMVLANLLASWCDLYASIFLEIGGARLAMRLQVRNKDSRGGGTASRHGYL